MRRGIVVFAGLAAALAGCGPGESFVPGAGTTCSIFTPEGAPARFVACLDGDVETIVAIVTPGSHCVAGGAFVEASLSCEDGTALHLSAEELDQECTLEQDGPSAFAEAPCQLDVTPWRPDP